MVLPFILLRAVHVEGPTRMGCEVVGADLSHTFCSPGRRKRNEVMILYYSTEEYVGRGMVCRQPLVFHAGGAM
jgi:hypothetical protein